MPQGQNKKKNAQKAWKAEVTEMNEQHIMAEWATHFDSLPGEDERLGRWRTLEDTLWNPLGGWKKGTPPCPQPESVGFVFFLQRKL